MALETDKSLNYKIADINIASLGQKRDATGQKYLGLMAVRKKYGRKKPLRT